MLVHLVNYNLGECMITNNDYLVHIHEEMLLLLTLGLGIKAHKSFIVDGDIIDMIEIDLPSGELIIKGEESFDMIDALPSKYRK